jgi:hypothetical protein
MRRRVGLPYISHAPRSKPKLASLYFWWPSKHFYYIAILEPPVSYLDSTVTAAACEIGTVFKYAGCTCFAYPVLSL